MLRYALTLTVLFLVYSPPVSAKTCSSNEIVAIAATDISGGTVTTESLDTSGADGLLIGVDLVDASNGITNIRLTFTESHKTAGTFRTAPLCEDAAPLLTCGQFRIDWNPQTYGKSFTMPIPWNFRWGKITAVTTGHGANDTLALTYRIGC